MHEEDNKRIVARAYLEGMNRRDMSVIRECFAENYANYFPAGQGELHGLDEFVASLEEFLGAFSDLVFTVEQVMADGDKVVLRWSATGVHTGDYRGLPPTKVIPATGRPVSFSATDIYHVVDGKIVEEWNTFDGYHVLDQMGVLQRTDLSPG